MAGVALLAGCVSYVHGYSVVVRYGVPVHSPEAFLYPALVDGPMYVASKVLFEDARRGAKAARKERRLRRSLAYAMLGAGISFTLFVNVLSGLSHGPLGAILMAWPAVAVAVSFELLMCLIRASAADPAPAASAPRVHVVHSPVREDVHEDVHEPAADGELVHAERVFAGHLAAGRLPTFRQIQDEFSCGRPRQKAIRAHLAAQLAA